MKQSRLIIPTVILCWCVSLGCEFHASSECARLCSLPYDQQNKTFLSEPLNKEIDLYLECTCKEDSVTSDYRFSGYIAKKGKEAIPSLVERLKSEKDEEKQLKIINAFSQMSFEDMHGRQDVVDLVKSTVANMKGSFLDSLGGNEDNKKYGQELATKIELNSKELDRH